MDLRESRNVVKATDLELRDQNRAALLESGVEVVDGRDLLAATEDDVIGTVDGFWGVIAGSEPYSAAVLGALPALRVIARPGVGYDAIDLAAAVKQDVVVFNTPGAVDAAVADHTLRLMLAVLGRLVECDQAARDERWTPSGYLRELYGTTVGLVGLGGVGRAVAKRLRGFDCRILAVEPSPDDGFCQRYGVEVMPLREVLPLVDVLSLHVPLTHGTRSMVGASELASLRPDAIVVNTSRGPIVDESALVAALAQGRIAGAGLDVFESEPLPPDSQLLRLPGVVLTGHLAYRSSAANRRMADGIVAGLIACARGEYPSSRLLP